MESFIRFLLKFKSLLLFLVLEAVAVVLMVNTGSYHHYVILSSVNAVTGNVSGVVGGVTGYFTLASENEDLVRQNRLLMNRVGSLETQLLALSGQQDSSALSFFFRPDSTAQTPDRTFSYISSKIVDLSVNRRLNYISLNKGRNDGIDNDMGVVSVDGAVGTVALVSDNFSLVLPIINLQSKTSCRLEHSNYLGSLVWDGTDPRFAYLQEIPRHAEVTPKEKVFTSGFSDIFPAGVPVGEVEEVQLDQAANFYTIKVRLSVDFQSLSNVYVVAFEDNGELVQLQDSVQKLNAQGR